MPSPSPIPTSFKLTIAYDGTRYAGWQVQKAGDRGSWIVDRKRQKPTIQGTLEEVLRRILREPVRIIGSGRTDKGVHAFAQVAHLRTNRVVSPDRLMRSLNQLIPSDISILKIERIPSSFHAQFDAQYKWYRYRVFTGDVASPFIRPYVYELRKPLNLALMRREASHLKNRHDFLAFARAGSALNGSIRKITYLCISRHGDEIHFDVEGTGFLHTMVRSIVGTLLDVGRGHLLPGTIRRMLKTRHRALAGTTAPAKGLALMSVGYNTRQV